MKERSLSGILTSAIIIVVLISISFTSGITYLLLKRYIEQESKEKFKIQRHQAESLLSLRISQLKGRLRSLINDNTIRVTLLLGVIPQLRERMEMLYFPENGAYFYVEGTIDKVIIPSPCDLHKELIKRILNTDKEMELFESFKGRPLLLLSKTIERRYEKVGRAVCIGGGVGVAPLLPIARALKDMGTRLISIIGARTKKMLILQERMRAISDELLITTDDGTAGHHFKNFNPPFNI